MGAQFASPSTTAVSTGNPDWLIEASHVCPQGMQRTEAIAGGTADRLSVALPHAGQ
jgi:hypothetical protein